MRIENANIRKNLIIWAKEFSNINLDISEKASGKKGSNEKVNTKSTDIESTYKTKAEEIIARPNGFISSLKTLFILQKFRHSFIKMVGVKSAGSGDSSFFVSVFSVLLALAGSAVCSFVPD